MGERALILFAHGARDARWAAPFERLRDLVRAASPGLAVELAFLEFMAPDLPTLAGRLVQDGCAEITLVPVFLGQGGHVLRDLPAMIDGLKSAYPGLVLKVAEAVGENADVLQAMSRYCLASAGIDPADGKTA